MFRFPKMKIKRTKLFQEWMFSLHKKPFPKNMILFFRREMKDDIFQKIQLCNCLICIIKTMCFSKTILIVELEKMSYRCLIVEIPPLK